MFSILPCKDADRLGCYPEGTTLLIYTEDSAERGFVAYRKNKSALEILAMNTGESVDVTSPVSDEVFLHTDALVRSVGSIALGEGMLTLCSRLDEFAPVFEKLGFFKRGEYYTLYLNKLFAKGCSGCNGCGGCK